MRWRRIQCNLIRGKASWAFISPSVQGRFNSQARSSRQRKGPGSQRSRPQNHVVAEPARRLQPLRLACLQMASESGQRLYAYDRINANCGLHTDAKARLNQAQIVLSVSGFFGIES